jgi:hypothetical protein
VATEAKRKIGGGKWLKRLIVCGLIVYVVVNPVDAAYRVHDTFFWIRSCFS